jgi:hypothetical protein
MPLRRKQASLAVEFHGYIWGFGVLWDVAVCRCVIAFRRFGRSGRQCNFTKQRESCPSVTQHCKSQKKLSTKLLLWECQIFKDEVISSTRNRQKIAGCSSLCIDWAAQVCRTMRCLPILDGSYILINLLGIGINYTSSNGGEGTHLSFEELTRRDSDPVSIGTTIVWRRFS